MRLTLEQIRSITAGALEVRQEEDGIHFTRCTPRQTAVWYGVRQDLGRNSEMTAGIKLDFYTNSRLFSFTPGAPGKYEIYIDNVLTYYYTAEDFVAEDFVAEDFAAGDFATKDLATDNFASGRKKQISLDGEEHRITLYLPAHSKGVLESVELEDGATIIRHKYDCKILFIGDSITQGWDSQWDSLSYAQCVSRFFNAEILNQAVSGTMFREEAFEEEINFEPDIIITAYGTNDWNYYKDPDEAKTHCTRFLDKMAERYSDRKVIGISPVWRGDREKDTALGSFAAWTSYIKENISVHRMFLIDGETLTPHHKDFYFDKFLHPNAIGFEIYALNLISQISKIVVLDTNRINNADVFPVQILYNCDMSCTKDTNNIII